LHEIIRPDLIQVNMPAQTHEEAIGSLVELLVARGEISPERASDATVALLKREAVGRTGLGNSVAVPHARVGFVSDFVGALGILRKGIAFGCLDGEPVRVVFLFLSPERDPSGHLQLMSVVSRLARDETISHRLASAPTIAEVFDHLREGEDEENSDEDPDQEGVLRI
jgi:mannitol/fructose-specific phosphotransferase system IIA component (Ntr-type)